MYNICNFETLQSYSKKKTDDLIKTRTFVHMKCSIAVPSIFTWAKKQVSLPHMELPAIILFPQCSCGRLLKTRIPPIGKQQTKKNL